MRFLLKTLLVLGLAAFAFAGGCRSAANVLIINDAGQAVEAAQVRIPVGMGGLDQAQLIASATLDPGGTHQISVPPEKNPDHAMRLRVSLAGSPRLHWLDLPRGGWYSVRITKDPTGDLALKMEERKPPEQADAADRQRRDIIDRPPSTFDRTPR